MDHLPVRGDSEGLPNIGLEELETKEQHQHDSNFIPTFGNPFHLGNENRIDQNFLGDYVTNVEEEDWVEDWDEDLDIHSYPTKKPQFSQRSTSPGGMRHFPADQSNDSLLEFLESAVRENMFPDKEGDIAVNLELKKHEFHNQRLKGLTEWLKNTSEVLHSTVSTDNSNDECNSRSMMEQEFQQHYPDVNVVERTVEKCEVQPTKESCVSYLEIVIKWIRGACHIFSDPVSRNGKPSPEVITRDKIDSLFLRCDYILHEQSKETRSRILECLKIWRDKFDLLPEVQLLDESAGSLVSSFLKLLRHQFSLCRIQLQLIEIKIHISSVDDLNSQLGCLETIMEKLVLLDEWLNFYHCHQRLHHVEDLPILLLELKAVCLSDKMLILANLSPITMQNLVNWDLSAPSHSRTENSSCYNVVYESNIGRLFVHLMVCLESPSIVRSRLAFAGCCYIQALLKDELPWQSGKYMMVVRVKHDVENLVDLAPADFGVQEVDIQYSTNDFSPTDFERNIIDMFSQSLGPIDESKNLQVLLFESVTDLFPTPKKLKEISHFLSYPNSSVFPHITGSLDLDLNLEVRQNGQIISRGYEFIPSNNIDEVVMGGHDSHYSNNVDIHRTANGASALMKHELYLYSFSLLSQFVNFISDSYPSITVELLDLCSMILAHLNLSDISRKFHKQAFLLAIRCGDCESAIKHGNILWGLWLHSQDIAMNIPNFVHTAELLAEQFTANAQYELAIKVYSNAARICFDLMRRESTTSRISNKRLINKQNKYFHCKVEGFLLNLGKAYLDFGHMHGAINIFKRLLMDYSGKIDSPNNDDRIIVFLSWILQGFYDLHDFDSCRRTIDVIKEVRKRNIHKPLDQMSSSGVERNSRSLEINNGNQNRIAWTTYHYLKNNSKGYLPQFVLNTHNIDLGVILSKIYYHTGQFVSALHALTPAIICTEMMVGGKCGAKEGVLQLADLYYLRGEIELAACRSAQSLTYPFEIGSSHHFACVQLLCAEAFSTSSIHGFDRNLYKKHSSKERESGIKEANRRSHVSSVGFGEAHGFRNKGTHQLHVFTCRRGAIYNDGGDLIWDAIRWFRRAWDFFHTAGDEINAAKSANRIAECNLLPIFVPHVFFGVPLQVALDLSNFDQVGIKSRSDGLAQTRTRNYHNGDPVMELQDDSIIRRFVSLDEVARITSFAYEIHLESSLPIELMESFMNLAELNLVTGQYKFIYNYCHVNIL